MTDYQEALYEGYGQRFTIDRMLHEDHAGSRRLAIFENARMGRVMTLDGVVQNTEADEFIQHEMLSHIPILAHGLARRVLIIGGADGAILREVARHRDVEQITLVEADTAMLEACKTFLPEHSRGAFSDARLNLRIDDAQHFLNTCGEMFDVIICAHIGRVAAHEEEGSLFQACRRCLNDGGILVARIGTPFMQLVQVQTAAKQMNGLFADWHFYQASVPTSCGGAMSFAWGACDPASRRLSLETLSQRFAGSGVVTRYYNPHVHLAAFALPQYVLQAIGKASNS